MLLAGHLSCVAAKGAYIASAAKATYSVLPAALHDRTPS